MGTQPLDRARLLATPTIDADAGRYSAADTGAAAELIRTTAWFMSCIEWVPIDGAVFEVRGHDPGSPGADAEYYLNNGVTDIDAQQPYVIAADVPPTRSIELKQIDSRVDVRDYSRAVLGQHYPAKKFQKRAKVAAVWAQWERGAMLGDAATDPQDFDGLARIVATGGGQSLASTTGDLRDFNRAMQLVKSHNNRVDLDRRPHVSQGRLGRSILL